MFSLKQEARQSAESEDWRGPVKDFRAGEVNREGGKRINNRTVIQLLGSLRATRCWQYIWRDGPLNMIVMFTRMSGEVDNQGLGRQKRKEIKYSCG